jgi:hypothetical protein
VIHVYVAPIPTMLPSPAAGSSRAVANWVAVRGFGTKVAGLGGLPGFAERYRTSSKLSGS